MTSLTPGGYAKLYAKEHVDFSGTILVDTLAPKGKGGRKGLGDRRLEFWADQGRAWAGRSKFVRQPDWHDSYMLHNGRCMLCGKMFAEQVLRYMTAPDPNAGAVLEVGRNIVYHCTETVVRAEVAHVVACPECAAAHGLQHDHRWPSWSNNRSDDQRVVYKIALHSGLAQFAQWPQVVIDLRAVVLNLCSEPSITSIQHAKVVHA